MAVISADPVPESREGSWNRLYQRNYTLAWRVECDSRLDGPYTIRLATHSVTVGGVTSVVPLLPRIGYSYYVSDAELDGGSFASEISYRYLESWSAGGVDGCAWLVTVNYTPYDSAQFGDTPVNWPVKVSFSSNKYDRALQVDVNGLPVLNSARQPFADPLTTDDNRSVITVVRNERIASVAASAGPPATPAVPGFDFTLAEQYRDTINNDVWNGFAAKTVKCSSITTTDPQFDDVNGYWYFAVTYVFEVNRDTWTRKLLDQGLCRVNPLSLYGGVTRIKDNQGQPVDDPLLLDGSGAVLPSTGTPVMLSFESYPALDFSVFNIDFNAALGK